MSVLRNGSVGPAVGQYQTDCNTSGISKLAIGHDLGVDEDFGPETLAVTHYLQKNNGLIDDGLVGPNTLGKLAELLGGHTTVPPGFVYGIDIYHGDTISDINKFAASNFSFVMHKTSEGNDYVDRLFSIRRKSVKEAGKTFGAYLYIHPNETAKSQADLFIKTLGAVESDELPPAIDWEEEDGQSTGHMNDVVAELVQRLRDGLGRNPFIYSSWGQLSGYDPRPALAAQPLWDADIRQGQAQPRLPAPWNKYTIWQYSFQASVPGIGNPCDVNKFQGDLNTLKQFIESSKV